MPIPEFLWMGSAAVVDRGVSGLLAQSWVFGAGCRDPGGRILVAMVGSVIDLDHEHAEAPREGPELLPRRWRWLAVAVAVAACGTVLVAGDPSSGTRLLELARVDPAPVVTMRVVEPTLYAVMAGGGPHLVGYRLTDGAQRWSVPLTVGGADAQVDGFD